MGLLDKIKDLEAEMARTQKNKATEHHFGLMKARLAKMRTELMEGNKAGGGKGEGFDVVKSGDARVALIGFPSVGKSTLLSTITKTSSEAAAYEFTTLTCIPGVIEYKDAKIQLLDLPGIIEGASKGKGRGRQVIAVARTSDMVLMMLDASKAEIQKELLTKELEAVGIRINQRPPDISFKIRKTGGVRINSMVDLTHIDLKLVQGICQLYRIFNADFLFRQDITVDQLIDVIEGNRKYVRCLYVLNKIDTISLDEVDRLAHQPDSVVLSCNWKLNLDYLLDQIWEYLDFIRIYTKPRGRRPVFSEPLILRKGSKIEDVCRGIHRDMVEKYKYSLVWGVSAKHQPQRVGIQHVVEDEDVIQIMTK
jgi:small GTP-binding protein